ncbi:MAG: DUF4112 domain-containing protein [Verrucomicrobiales bacterium]|nr:DUF4112 domain-containing protein [Verrucomicrobiales bacterium]
MADEEPKGDLAEGEDRSNADPLQQLRSSKRISWLLDECIRIPGTQIRFGLDPILGLIPYGGETVATVIGAFILGDAGKKGLPFRTLTKMSGNMMINAGVGWIPVVGDLFSVWFKSNSRNYRMLNTYLDSDHGEEESGGWWPAILVVSVIGSVLILNVLAWIFVTTLVVWIYTQLTGAAL